MIALTFSFGFNAWEGNFPFICASNSPTLLKLLAPFASSSCEYLTLFPVEKTWHFVARTQC
jgi:hypothetical protein